MKKLSALLLAGMMTFTAQLKAADYDLDSAGPENFQQFNPEFAEKQTGPFTVSIKGDWFAKAKLRHHHRGNLRYAHAEANAVATVWYNECNQEGLQFGVGYEYSKLDWHSNPFFRKKNYHTFTASTTYFTQRLCDWKWVASLNYNIDAEKWNFNKYSTWDILLWGRYSYSDCFGIHTGIYAETGMKMDRVWPVLGFDLQITERIKLNAVYPLNMSLVYTVNENWNVAGVVRTFSDRHRAGDKGFYRKAVWRYSNMGTEGAINYVTDSGRINANAHAGYALGGRVRIANMHNHHSRNRRLRGCFYAGGSLSYNF